MDTSRLTSFVAAAETGSLSQAAVRLGQQLSTLSRHVGELEAHLGARLFERTGRGVRLTEVGGRFLARARTVLKELELARAEANARRSVELPVLRLSAPPDLAQHLLPVALAGLAARHPNLSVSCRNDVRRVSLVEEIYDAVIRLGPLAPSELIARKLGSVTMRLYTPDSSVKPVRALGNQEVVLVEGVPTGFNARSRGRPVKVVLRGKLTVSSFAEAGELAVLTGRWVLLPSFSAWPFLRSGKLFAHPGFTFTPVALNLLRTPRHRGSRVLDELARLVTAALEAAERAAR